MKILRHTGQATVECVLVLVVLVIVSLLSLSSFIPQVRDEAENLFHNAYERISQAEYE